MISLCHLAIVNMLLTMAKYGDYNEDTLFPLLLQDGKSYVYL